MNDLMERNFMKTRILPAVLSVLALSISLTVSSMAGQDFELKRGTGIEPIDIERYRGAAVRRWESAIAGLEVKDRTETHPDNSILFVGSSSIRRWKHIAVDLAPYRPIQRGYGGAKWSDVAIFADRLI